MNYFFLKVDSKWIRVTTSDILYVEGAKDYLKVITKSKLFVIHCTMKRFIDFLPKHLFVQVHKSYLVNIAEITSIEGNIIELTGKEIPIGHNYKELLFSHLTIVQ